MALFNSLLKKQTSNNEAALDNNAFYSYPNNQVKEVPQMEVQKYYQPSVVRQRKQPQIQDGYNQRPMDDFVEEFNIPVNNPYQQVSQEPIPVQNGAMGYVNGNQFQVNNNYLIQQEQYMSRDYQVQQQVGHITPTTEIPGAIAHEIRSEKLKQFFIFILSLSGVVASTLFLMSYYNEELMGISKNSVLHPTLSIPMLLISSMFMLLTMSDWTLLSRSMVRYRNDLANGIDSVPYFLTRNYKNFTRRSVYVNWMSFTVYVVGVILLLIFYGLQAQYNSGQTSFYIFFWRVAELKSLVSEIVVTTIVLVGTLLVHIIHIVWTKARKNNIIGYYGHEIIHPTELAQIKKSANIKCAIILFVILAILLFAIFIPWLIIRKKGGKSLMPIGRI